MTSSRLAESSLVGKIRPIRKILKVCQVQRRSLDETSLSCESLPCPKHCQIWKSNLNGAQPQC